MKRSNRGIGEGRATRPAWNGQSFTMAHPNAAPAPLGAERELRRWMVVGSGGAGKTRLSLALGQALDLPVLHLDRHYWNAGWTPTSDDDWDAAVTALAAREAWVIDGNYSRTLHLRLMRAQAVILLDPPPLQCPAGVVRRSILRGEARPDMAAGCTERIVPDFEFLRYVANYRRRSRPRVLRKIAEARHVRLYWFRSRPAAWAFVGGLRAATVQK
jgi:adenylate kinase family enzyme